MKCVITAIGGKAPLPHYQQSVEGAAATLDRIGMIDRLFDGTATLTVTDENGARLSIDDLQRAVGSDDA